MKTKTRAFYLLVNEIEKINFDLFTYIKTFSRFFHLLILIAFDSIKFKTLNLYKSHLSKDPIVPRLELIKSITKRMEHQNIVYVKFFQAFCLEQNILFNDEKDYLIKYIDNVPFNTDEIDYELLDKINSQFNVEIYYNLPINSGIIGIVFPGIIRNENDNKKVVVKILKKNITSKLISVFQEIELITKIIQWIPYLNQLNLNKLFLDNKELLLNQTNFIEETSNIEIFKSKNENIKEFIIPKVYKEITDKFNNVIVMENIKGLTINDLAKYDEDICDNFGKLLIKFGYISIIMTRAVHLDLHAGNVFFYINKEDDSLLPKYQIGIIDFGLCCFPSREFQNTYYVLCNDIVHKKKFNEVKKILENIIHENDIYDNLTNENKNKLLIEVMDSLKKSLDNKLDASFLIDLSIVLKKYNLNFSKEFNQICLSLNSCDSLGSLLCKDVQSTIKQCVDELSSIYKMIEI
tara:strand:+ start:1625 stop:3013 length:1389 start_codon:yes stop_codon:yes gene_type:complete